MSNRFVGDAGESSGMGCLGLVAIALIFIYFGATTLGGSFYNEHSATCTVTDKDRGADSDGNSHYRIYTRQCGVLADEDRWLRGKTNSADVWSQMTVGHTYRLRIVGYRFGLTSDFPNVLRVEQEVRRG